MYGQYKRLTGLYDGTYTGKGLSFGGSSGRTQATGYEPINGTSQPLVMERHGDRTLLRGVLVRDYPVLLRLR